MWRRGRKPIGTLKGFSFPITAIKMKTKKASELYRNGCECYLHSLQVYTTTPYTDHLHRHKCITIREAVRFNSWFSDLLDQVPLTSPLEVNTAPMYSPSASVRAPSEWVYPYDDQFGNVDNDSMSVVSSSLLAHANPYAGTSRRFRAGIVSTHI
jgi:hypothetical protein